jgi:hypothetical protein
MVDGQGKMEHHGYIVVPAALRNAQRTYDQVTDRWDNLRDQVRSWKFEDDSLGLLGKLADVISYYNSAVDKIAEKLTTGSQSLRAASDALDAVAKAYEAQDEEYYAKFGWIQQEMDTVS